MFYSAREGARTHIQSATPLKTSNLLQTGTCCTYCVCDLLVVHFSSPTVPPSHPTRILSYPSVCYLWVRFVILFSPYSSWHPNNLVSFLDKIELPKKCGCSCRSPRSAWFEIRAASTKSTSVHSAGPDRPRQLESAQT